MKKKPGPTKPCQGFLKFFSIYRPGSQQFMLNKIECLIFVETTLREWEGDWKIQHRFGNKVLISIAPIFLRFPAIHSCDQFSGRNKEHSLRNGQFSVQRTGNQCNWSTLNEFPNEFCHIVFATRSVRRWNLWRVHRTLAWVPFINERTWFIFGKPWL